MIEKEKSVEEIMEEFLKTLEQDGKALGVEAVYKYLNRIVFDTFDFGGKGFQPILNFTLYVRGDGRETDFVFRPTRTDNHELYKQFRLDVLGKAVSESWAAYCREVWGMSPFEEREDLRVDVNKAKEVLGSWGHLKGK